MSEEVAPTPSRLPVYFETRPVGTIEVVEGGPRFVYDPAWLALKGAFAISLTMPLTAPIHDPKALLPWIVNLLPESAKTLSALKGALKDQRMSGPPDVIDLLFRMGRDTAGALSIGHPGTSIVENKWRRVPDDATLERILNELPLKPFLIGDEGVSMLLAGVQTKLAVAMQNGAVHIPIDGAPSTHVLKPDSDRLPGGVQNEAFCLTLAAKAGIPTPNVTTGTAGARSYLLVERYDRRHDGQRWRRLHQEDFCQALGYPPEELSRRLPGPVAARPCRRDAEAHADPGHGALRRPRHLQRDRLEHGFAREELFDHALGARCVDGTRLRHRLRRPLFQHHAQHGAEDRRPEARRPTRAKTLGEVRLGLRTLSFVGRAARPRDRRRRRSSRARRTSGSGSDARRGSCRARRRRGRGHDAQRELHIAPDGFARRLRRARTVDHSCTLTARSVPPEQLVRHAPLRQRERPPETVGFRLVASVLVPTFHPFTIPHVAGVGGLPR